FGVVAVLAQTLPARRGARTLAAGACAATARWCERVMIGEAVPSRVGCGELPVRSVAAAQVERHARNCWSADNGRRDAIALGASSPVSADVARGQLAGIVD